MKLDAQFNKVSMSSAMDVYGDFSQAKLEPNEDVSDLANRISASYRKLKELKYTLERLPESLLSFMLSPLPLRPLQSPASSRKTSPSGTLDRSRLI